MDPLQGSHPWRSRLIDYFIVLGPVEEGKKYIRLNYTRPRSDSNSINPVYNLAVVQPASESDIPADYERVTTVNGDRVRLPRARGLQRTVMCAA